MLLEHALLSNVCQHKHLELQFKPGITGIFGPNGAGKSNLVNMIKASLTNDFSVNPGIKEDNVRWGLETTDASFITSSWRHEGKSFAVTRGLKNRQSKLVIEGRDEDIRKALDITAEIEKLIGISKHIIDDFVFVEQWKIFEFMSSKPQDRANTFAHLCGTSEAERLYKLLGEQISQDSVLASSVIDTTEDIHRRVMERIARINEMSEDRARARKKVLKKDEGVTLEALIKSSEKALMLQELKTKSVARQTQLQTQLASAAQALKRATKQLNISQTSVESLSADAKASEEYLSKLEEYTRASKRKADLTRILDAPVPIAPKKPKDYSSWRELSRQAGKAEDEAKALRTRVATFEEKGAVNCPMCDTPTAKLKDKLVSWQELATNKAAEARKLQALADVCFAYDETLTKYKTALETYTTRTKDAEEELKHLVLPKISAKESVSDHKARISAFEEATDALAAAESSHKVALREHDKATDEFASADDEVARLSEELSNVTVDSKKVGKAKQALAEHREAKNNIQILDSRIGDLEALNKSDEEETERVQQLLERTEVARKWISDLESYREVVHRDNLPRLAAQRSMENMVETINETLADFDSPFYVEASEDLTFIAVKPNGRREPASRLSGGEKVILALAFRFAVNSLFAGDVGMMVLDEPTAGIDVDNLDCLTDVLLRISAITKERERQLIIITHDHRIERAFDEVIQLKKVT